MSKNKVPPLDNFLREIEKIFITIKDRGAQFKIFEAVFNEVMKKMKEVNNYFERYSSKIQYAGSFYDGVKVGKLDEFDMDIIVRLPIDYSEIVIENDRPGFVKLKIERAFDFLDKQPNWETHNKETRDWRDSKKYFLQSQFRAWMESVVIKAVEALNRQVTIGGVTYKLSVKKSGPAFTVNCRSADGRAVVDVDIVPVIQFRLPRWPEGYRRVVVEGDSNKNTWFVVPKPNKDIKDPAVQNRCWRLAFHDQERDLINNRYHLKTTVKLLKKLRDSQGLTAIASYYIKTLFLWKAQETEKTYWTNSLSVVFRDMLREFHDALEARKIPYFWNPGYNLIGSISSTTLSQYQAKLKNVLMYIDQNSIIGVVKALITEQEFENLKNTTIYKTYIEDQTPKAVAEKPNHSTARTSVNSADNQADLRSTQKAANTVSIQKTVDTGLTQKTANTGSAQKTTHPDSTRKSTSPDSTQKPADPKDFELIPDNMSQNLPTAEPRLSDKCVCS